MAKTDSPATPWSGPSRPAPANQRGRRTSPLAILVAIGLIAFIGVLAVTVLVNVWDRIWLDRHGVLTYATVDAVRTEDAGEDGSTTYVTVEIPFCSCHEDLHVGSDRHPPGSMIAIRYDPNDLRHAEVAEDVPGDDISFAGFFLILLLGLVVSVIVGRRARNAWRAKAVEMGWSFDAKPALDLSIEPRGLGPGKVTYSNASSGAWHGVRMTASICTVTKGGGESSSAMSAFMVAVDMDESRPSLWVGPTKLSKRAKAIGPIITTGDVAFDRAFTVYSQDAAFAHAFVDDRLRTLLTTPPDAVRVETRGSRLFVFSTRGMRPASLDRLLDEASLLERHLRQTAMPVPVPGPVSGPVSGGLQDMPRAPAPVATPPAGSLPSEPSRPGDLDVTPAPTPTEPRPRRAARFVLDGAISLLAMFVVLLFANAITSAVGRDPERTENGTVWGVLVLYLVLASAWFRFRRSTEPLQTRVTRLATWIAVVVVATCILDIVFSPIR